MILKNEKEEKIYLLKNLDSTENKESDIANVRVEDDKERKEIINKKFEINFLEDYLLSKGVSITP